MELVGEIVTDALGERPARVVHIPTLEASSVYRIELSSCSAYFKSEHEGHPIAIISSVPGSDLEHDPLASRSARLKRQLA